MIIVFLKEVPEILSRLQHELSSEICLEDIFFVTRIMSSTPDFRPLVNEPEEASDFGSSNSFDHQSGSRIYFLADRYVPVVRGSPKTVAIVAGQ